MTVAVYTTHEEQEVADGQLLPSYDIALPYFKHLLGRAPDVLYGVKYPVSPKAVAEASGLGVYHACLCVIFS